MAKPQPASGDRRRRLRPRRVITFVVIVFLLLGAIVNIAVAGALLLWKDFDGARDLSVDETSELFESRGMLHPTKQNLAADLYGFGIRWRFAEVVGNDSRGSATAVIQIYDVGWPFKSFRAEWRGKISVASALSVPLRLHSGLQTGWKGVESQMLWSNLVIPTELLAVGFLLNSGFYAVMSWLPVFVIRYWYKNHRRSVKRFRRGQCPACGYQMGQSPRCTECGNPLPGRAEAV